MKFPKCLAGHLFGHQEMSECLCSYFRKETSVCGLSRGEAAAVVGIQTAHCCFLLLAEMQTSNNNLILSFPEEVAGLFAASASAFSAFCKATILLSISVVIFRHIYRFFKMEILFLAFWWL